ncbi:hypothetical protein [Halocynthiibacter styelae]|uniref:hypothetical protein n=1 Tax=Halocynthiibacter styelae TaxID=2761955 RepID=UPI002B4B9942|nr:hypothetical protein [Paenihalocynthiibacter styelae]
MSKFDDILMMAVERKGGFDAVLGDIPPPKSAAEIAAVADRDWLAQMARSIFQAGISWKVVENKWPGIHEAFDGFDAGRLAMIAKSGLTRF